MGEKRRSTSKTLAKNKKRKGTHLTKKTIRDEKRPSNSKIDSDDVNEEERVPEEEESKKNESKLPEDFEEDERNLESAAADDDGGVNSELKMESQRRPKKKKKKMKKIRLCPHTLKSNCYIKDQSYFDRLHAKYPKMLPYIQKIAQSVPKKKMNPGPIPYYEASPTFIKESMKQMKIKEESEKTTKKKKDVSVSKAQEIPKPRCLTWDPPPTWNPASRKKMQISSRSRRKLFTEVDAIIKSLMIESTTIAKLKSP